MATPPDRLNNSSLTRVPPEIGRPDYDRSKVTPGIVHLGIGAFHRAHQAVYTDSVLAQGEHSWGIIGASLRGTDVQTALCPQNGLYTVASRDGSATSLRIIGSVLDVLSVANDRERILAVMADPQIRIVSLTVTEKGYYHEPASGRLLIDHPAIQHDIAQPQHPRTPLGFLLAALVRRRDSGQAPFAVLCCDNLPHNGKTVHQLLIELAAASKPELSRWIESELACPATMVDRMVPATSAADASEISAQLGLNDAWPVVSEPFSQWVMEDNFPSGRPRWEDAGATLTHAVGLYETMKLRLLNGCHSAIAYLGALRGYATVAEAMADADVNAFIRGLMSEIAPTLRVPPEVDLASYQNELMTRFANPALGHRTLQIAMDGSQKLPQRLLGTVRERLEAGLPIRYLATTVAFWLRFLQGRDEQGHSLPLDDPLAALLQKAAQAAQPCREVLSLQQVFGTDLTQYPQFQDEVCGCFETLILQGVVGCIRNLNTERG